MKALSLFTGIMGIDLACEWAEIETVAMCERDPFCQKVIRKHKPDIPLYDDVCELTKERLEQDGIVGRGRTIDIIHGGIPCQPYSENGKKLGENDPRDMWPHMRRIIGEIRPTWVLVENVDGFIRRGFDRVTDDLQTSGYGTRTYNIPANAFGAEHQRYRVFIVAHDKSKRVERVWTQGEQVARSLDKTLLPLRHSDGQWKVEPDIRRVDDGIPNRMDRLKSLGNAVVPHQVYPILQIIADIQKTLD